MSAAAATSTAGGTGSVMAAWAVAFAPNWLVRQRATPATMARVMKELRATLIRFALAYRRRVLGAQGIAMFRALVPEVPRFRPLARSMYAAGAGQTVRRLAAYLQKAMDAGQLRRDDPELAAELLMGMLVGQDRIKRLFGVANGKAGDAQRAERIVDCFLRAYRK